MAATDRRGRVYAIGGALAGVFRSIVERYDPATGTWSAVSPLPMALCCGAATTGLGGRIFVIGVGRGAGRGRGENSGGGGSFKKKKKHREILVRVECYLKSITDHANVRNIVIQLESRRQMRNDSNCMRRQTIS